MLNDAEKDLQIAKYMIEKGTIPSFDYSYIYPWSNEDIYSYYNYVKNINSSLTITSSGDHVIYAALANSKTIDAVDINKLAKYYSALKIALIRSYDINNFKKLFKVKRTKIFSIPLLHKVDLKEINAYLSDSELYFWNGIIKNKKLKDNFLYRYDGFYFINLLPMYARDKNLYKDLQKKLSECKITYYDSDLLDIISKLPNKYDCVYLSNVLERIYSDHDKEKLIQNMKYILNDEGKILAYRKNLNSDDFLRKFTNDKKLSNVIAISKEQIVTDTYKQKVKTKGDNYERHYKNNI